MSVSSYVAKVIVEEMDGKGIVVERAMYFDYYGRRGGHAALGVQQTSTGWFFAEGYTGPGFDEYICVLNPGDEIADQDLHRGGFSRPVGTNNTYYSIGGKAEIQVFE